MDQRVRLCFQNAEEDVVFLSHPKEPRFWEGVYITNWRFRQRSRSCTEPTWRDDEKDHPVAYFSRKLLPRETRYSTIEKECLAIKLGIQAFSTYLLGRKFKVQTDHRSLKWLSQLKESNSRLTRWSLFLQTYDFSISHRSGKKNANADTLSRLGHQTCLMQEKEGEMWEVTYTILELSGVTLRLSIDCSGTFMCHVKNCCLCCFWLLYWLLLVF